jgi:glycosyltransferase involved in cell wall biosynthesis
MPSYRLLVLTSHPIQYQAPMHRVLAASGKIDLTVLFCSKFGLNAYHDKGFGREVQWDIPLLQGYTSFFLKNWSWNPGLNGFWGLLNPDIIGWIAHGRCDAVLVHGWGRATNWIAMLTAVVTGTPLLVRGETNLLNPLSTTKQFFKRSILKALFARTAGFLSIGRHNAEFYRSYGVPENKIHLTPYAVDNQYWLSQADALLLRKSELKQSLGFDRKSPIVLFSGKLVAVKRPMDLLRAFEAVAESLNAGLVFLGDGELRADLEAYVRERSLKNVRFVGFKNQTEMPPYYSMADVFVLPSAFEPWGLVVNEALCFGLPVITSDKVGATGDLVQEGINGFIYPAGDVVALTARLQNLLLSAEDRRTSMGAASRKLVSHWSYREVVEGLLECLQRVSRLPRIRGEEFQ